MGTISRRTAPFTHPFADMRSRTFIFVLAGFFLAVAGNSVLAQQDDASDPEADPEWESELIGKISASQFR